MKFDLNEDKEVVVLLGAGDMGLAIIKRISAGKKILLADINEEKLESLQKDLTYSGYDVETQVTDAMDEESIKQLAQKADSLGKVMYFIDTAGASPSQASPEHIINLDLIGTSYAIDEFGKVMARGGAGLIISSMTGYMHSPLTPEDENQLRTTETSKLKELECLSEDVITNPGIAYVVSKKANQLRVQYASATSWAEKGARINTISPGIIVTPLAYDEFNSSGEGYQRMIDVCGAKRVGTSDEIAFASEFLLSNKAGFITGIDLLIDGGTIAALYSGLMDLEIH